MHLNLRGDLVNSGDIAGRQVVSINATNLHNIQGGAISGRAVGLQATQDINIIGATVTAQDVLSVRAGGDVTVASTTQTLQGGGFHAYEQTSLNRVAGLYVTNPGGPGVLSADAGGIHFWYGARSLKEAPYIEEMEQLARQHPNFSWHLVLSDEA